MKNLSNYKVIGKKVLFRADLNVPVLNGVITDSSRILAIKSSIQTLIKDKNKITEKKPEESTVHQNLLKSFQKIIKDDIYEIRESEIISKNTATKLETRISLVETSFKYPNLICNLVWVIRFSLF